MAKAPRHGAAVGQCVTSRPCRRRPLPRAGSRTHGLWVAVAVVAARTAGRRRLLRHRLARPGSGDGEGARRGREEAEAKRRKAEQEAAKLRAAERAAPKAEQAAAELKRRRRPRRTRQASQIEEEARRKIEAEIGRAEARRRGGQAQGDERQAGARLEDAARRSSSWPGQLRPFRQDADADRLEGRADEIRLQGVDIVNDPALRQLGGRRPGREPRNLHCRQTDRLTDGTPLYRCLITPTRRQGAAGRGPRHRARRPRAGAGAQRPGPGILRRAAILCRRGGRCPWPATIALG